MEKSIDYLVWVVKTMSTLCGRSECEDDLRAGVQLVLRSGLQSACTTLQVKDGEAFKAGLDSGSVYALEPVQKYVGKPNYSQVPHYTTVCVLVQRICLGLACLERFQ